MRRLAALLAAAASMGAETVRLDGIARPVEILRDRWGIPHIYAANQKDLFFAQGYMAARDRLFQIDLWRRVGTGRLAEVLGPQALARDRLARAVGYRGDWEREWRSYSPDTREIVTAFTGGINQYIRSLDGKRPLEFRLAGYDPGLWKPEDCLARMAGLLMTRNLTREIARAEAARELGLEKTQKYMPPDPFIRLEVPKGLDLADITPEIIAVYSQAIGPVRLEPEQQLRLSIPPGPPGPGGAPRPGAPERRWALQALNVQSSLSGEGSNNWVVDGTRTVTGKPLLANDPHRPVLIPALRKTVHLVAPGWNAIGAGEPGLPGIALGHNEKVAFGFTIVGLDQVDLYVEKLNPANPDQYRYKGAWRNLEVERDEIAVKGGRPEPVELRRTVHGPVIHEDRKRNRAYSLRWVGMEPGTAGYLAGLALARARNWSEFRRGLARYHVPGENIVYADTEGNIGWQAAGLMPVRRNWPGLFPVPGDTGEYEWSGFRPAGEMPYLYNPASHAIATANHNILPPGYRHALNYDWSLPFRHERVQEMLAAGGKFSVADFERMQQDVVSVAARRFQGILRKWSPAAGSRAGRIVEQLLRWDAALRADSEPALIYEAWIQKLPAAVFGPALAARTDLGMLLKTLEAEPNPKALEQALEAALGELGPLGSQTWGDLHRITFRHPLNLERFHRGPIARPGDAHTVNSTSGPGFLQTAGASYRQIMDLSDWDRSVMTNVPGESGDPESPHYSDLIEEWGAGKYHPMLYSRKAVEAATVERIRLEPR